MRADPAILERLDRIEADHAEIMARVTALIDGALARLEGPRRTAPSRPPGPYASIPDQLESLGDVAWTARVLADHAEENRQEARAFAAPLRLLAQCVEDGLEAIGEEHRRLHGRLGREVVG